MVSVIRNLVVHLPRLRVHLVQPLEAPINLIHYVRDSIPARSPVSPMVVRERLRIALVGEHHLVNGVGRGGCVLKAVRRVMPTTRHVKECTVLLRIRMPDDDSVLAVTAVFEERVPAAALLTHVVQHEIGRTIINHWIYREYLRAGLAS